MYLLIQIYVVFPHQRNFINMNYLKPDGIMKSKGILYGLHRNVTRLSREMSTPLSSPPETKAMVYRGMHWGGEYHFQWWWVRAYLQLIWSMGQGSERNITLVPSWGMQTWDNKASHHLGEDHVWGTGMPCGHLPRGQGGFGHGALLSYLSAENCNSSSSFLWHVWNHSTLLVQRWSPNIFCPRSFDGERLDKFSKIFAPINAYVPWTVANENLSAVMPRYKATHLWRRLLSSLERPLCLKQQWMQFGNWFSTPKIS